MEINIAVSGVRFSDSLFLHEITFVLIETIVLSKNNYLELPRVKREKDIPIRKLLMQ